MVTYTAAIEWTRNRSDFAIPSSEPVNGDPEQAFVAALSSSHMRCFLKIAAMFGYTVEYYRDTPEANIATNCADSPWVAHVVLQPEILFTGAHVPTDAVVLALHHAAHAECSLANSVSTLVKTLGVWHHESCVDSD